MSLSRRTFITQIGLGTGLISLSPMAVANPLKKRKLAKFGFISGIVDKELKEDWKGTLKKAAALGYKEMEIGKHLGDSPKEFLSFCSDIGITPVGGGIKMSKDQSAIDARLDQLAELNLKYAIAYWPWFVSAPFSLENCKESAEALNKIGEAAKKRGMVLSWHNHDKEFTPMEKGLPFDYLMQHTDKDLVKCEMDVYWTVKGGADPVTQLKKYSGRYQALHIKDMAKDESQTFECVGQGKIDFAPIFAEAYKQGIKHFLVEKDDVKDGLACLNVSSAYLKNIRY